MSQHIAELAWLAGILDGEGCLYATFVNSRRLKAGGVGNVSLRVEVHTVSARMINSVVDILQKNDIYFIRSLPRMQPLSKRPAIKVTVSRKSDIKRLLELVVDYLRVKDNEARAILQYLEKFPPNVYDKSSSEEERHTFINAIRDMKKVA